MTDVVESIEHESEIESGQDQIIKRLDAIIFLLETIANLEHGNTLNIIDGD